MGTILNEIQGAVLIRNNILRYIAPSNPEKTDTLLYELVDTEFVYALGTLIVQF